MKMHACVARFPALLVAVALLPGCGPGDGGNHDHAHHDDHDHGHDHGHGHGHAQEHDQDQDHHQDDHEAGHGEAGAHAPGQDAPAGASFTAGKGVLIKEETKPLLGLEIGTVVERNLPRTVAFPIQIFGEVHRPSGIEDDHSGCDVHGSGMLPLGAAEGVKAGQAVTLTSATPDPRPIEGLILRIKPEGALGEAEVIVGIRNGGARFKGGEFLTAKLSTPREAGVPVLPRAALLRTAEGAFVYATNGDAYLRTPVRTGTVSGEWIEIIEGVRPGDQVVIRPVETLWLIELRATRGGGHSH